MFTVKLELDQNYHMPASTYNHPASGWKTASKPWRVQVMREGCGWRKLGLSYYFTPFLLHHHFPHYT